MGGISEAIWAWDWQMLQLSWLVVQVVDLDLAISAEPNS